MWSYKVYNEVVKIITLKFLVSNSTILTYLYSRKF